MRKFIVKLFSIFVAVSVLCATLAGCDLFSSSDDGSNSNNKSDKTVNIVVHNGTASKNYTVTVGKMAKIDPVYKNGYYPLGFFTEEDGGEKYFDYAGDSVSVWQEEYPTEFYAHYDSLENFEEITWEYSGEKQMRYNYYEPSIDKNSQAYYAMMGNMDKTLEIHESFRLKMNGSSSTVKFTHYVNFYNKTGNTKELFAKSPQFTTIGTSWEDFEFTLECSAKIFQDDMKIAMEITYSPDNVTNYYAKEMVLTVKFLND